MKVKSEGEVTQSCPTLCNPMDCSLPGSSVHGIFQLSLLEWVAISFSVYSRRVIIFGLHNYVSWDIPQLAVSRPENQESQWWNSSSTRDREWGIDGANSIWVQGPGTKSIRAWVQEEMDVPAKVKRAHSPFLHLFCSIRVLNGLYDAHAHWRGSSFLNLPIQKLLSPRTLSQTTIQIMFYHLYRNPVSQSSWQTEFMIKTS